MKLLRFFARVGIVFGAGVGVAAVTATHVPGGLIGNFLFGLFIAAACIVIVCAWSWRDWPTDR